MKDPFLPLTRPNPLIINQDRWDKSKVTVYNISWRQVVINPDAKLDEDDRKILEEIRHEPQVIVEQKVAVKEVVTSPEIPIVKNEKPKDKFLEDHVIVFHCLPAIIRQHTDSLYGDSYQKIDYGDKFKFEGVVIKQDEYFLAFWTNLEKLENNSIVYPSMYRNGAKYNQFRWWKTMQTEPKNGGLIVSCTISDHQPHFAD
jgi:hypothetical protein